MCGIAGFISPDSAFTSETLQSGTLLLRHRGPDAGGYFFEQGIGLGHRRLSIIDLSASANQPMTSACGRYSIVFNGEVYNFKELAPLLPIAFKTHSDTEVVLEAYAHWGAECLQRFNGMFAFAIFDHQEQSLFIARDRIGVKPIFYYHSGHTFAFASELKVLMHWFPDNRKLNHTAIAGFLHLNYIPEPHTIYQGFHKFPSAHYALVKKGEIQWKAYWDLETHISDSVMDNEAQAKKQLHALLQSSIAYRMISDVPFGTFLSGGIDSSLVTAIAQSQSEQAVNTFNISFDFGKFNESAYAQQVAKHLGTKHHTLQLGEHEALELFDRIFTAYDEPYADASAISTMLVSRFARQHVTMTLSGDGGDELFFGYGFYTWRNRLENPLLSSAKPLFRWLLGLGNARMERIARLMGSVPYAHLPSHIYSQESLNYSRADLQKLLLHPGLELLALKEHHTGLKRKLSPAESQALFDIRYYLKDDLMTKVDRASMQFSLESREPLLDYRLLEFAVNLSPDLKLKDGQSKYLLKQVLFDYVPKQLFDRPKWGFGIPLVKWLRKELYYLQEQYLTKAMFEKHGILQYDIFRPFQMAYNAGKDYCLGRVWLAIVLHAYLERHPYHK